MSVQVFITGVWQHYRGTRGLVQPEIKDLFLVRTEVS